MANTFEYFSTFFENFRTSKELFFAPIIECIKGSHIKHIKRRFFVANFGGQSGIEAGVWVQALYYRALWLDDFEVCDSSTFLQKLRSSRRTPQTKYVCQQKSGWKMWKISSMKIVHEKWIGLIGQFISILRYLKHFSNFKKISVELYDLNRRDLT